MHSQKHFLAPVLGSFVLAMVGCDSEPTDDDTTAVEADEDDTVDHADDDDPPSPDEPDDRVASPDAADGLEPSPCGNGVLDPGEECDDGWLNGPELECTDACTFNECDLDEDGRCTDSLWPQIDFDLYPCPAETPADECDPLTVISE